MLLLRNEWECAENFVLCFFVVSSAKISWNHKKSWMAKKASLRKTYRCQTEANDKVWSLKKETEKALETLAILHERLEQVNSDLTDIHKKFEKELEKMVEAMRLRSLRSLPYMQQVVPEVTIVGWRRLLLRLRLC